MPPSKITRIAAKGDGVTGDGEHIAGALPGDTAEGGAVTKRGQHHREPACQHFGRCGGCQLQHADDPALVEFVQSRVVNAASGQGVEAREVLPVHLSPPQSRRRATLHGLRTAKGAVLGFREGSAHRIVDLAECAVIAPEISKQIDPLRALIAQHGPKGGVDAQLTVCDQGIDLGLSNFPLEGLSAIEAMVDFAREHGLARLTVDQRFGAETQWEPEPATISLSGVPVPMPPGAFLQATHDAEERMIADAREWLEDTRMVADLFAGLGTFAFGLREGRKVLAAEADQAAHLATKSVVARAGGTVFPIHRDLFRNPLQVSELNRFDGVLLDPPRAGAKVQVAELAKSECKHVVYISCNPSSWARDAATLIEGGYVLKKLRPVGQFRWSTHVELTSLFVRDD